MTEPTAEWKQIPDSEWLAPLVVQAFTERRFELGAALARLTVQAERIERDRKDVGSAKLPIYEDVNRTGTVYAHQHVQTPGQPHEPADEPKELPQAEVTPSEVAHPVTPTARCIALVGDNGAQGECHGVIYWAVAESRWTHLDPTYNTHEPFADRPLS